jgi:hypothetical protein
VRSTGLTFFSVGNFSRATTQAKSRTAAGIGARLLGRSSRLPRCVPCSRLACFKAVLDTMDKGGFKGPLSVEIEFRGDPWPPLTEVNRAMKASYDKLTSLGLS